MKISFLIILLTSLVSLSSYALDRNLDPNAESGIGGPTPQTEAIGDWTTLVPGPGPCKICNAFVGPRHTKTAASKGGATTIPTGAPATGADSGGNGH